MIPGFRSICKNAIKIWDTEKEISIAEEISRNELSIPMYYGMTEEEIVTM